MDGRPLEGLGRKGEVQSFKLVKSDENRIYFDGFTFDKINDNEINIYALIENEGGSTEEVKFNYIRYKK
ncbi:hypothetical protein SAMN05421636_101272 [Pricia antarctica]|uniref:Uncharacterized protein n=1 Tax=Pricia antarctica TaxID=641691 RepID=A0A1G6WFD0_9FLAO|nr:hypothetical protein SAMN05421636_101272 [Pricia antarctica]